MIGPVKWMKMAEQILGCTERPQILLTLIRVRSTFENWAPSSLINII